MAGSELCLAVTQRLYLALLLFWASVGGKINVWMRQLGSQAGVASPQSLAPVRPGSCLLCPLQAQPDLEAELAVAAPGSKSLSIQLFLLQEIQHESTIWGVKHCPPQYVKTPGRALCLAKSTELTDKSKARVSLALDFQIYKMHVMQGE